LNIEDRISLLRFRIGENAHIKVDKEICKECNEKVCLVVCPAGCYKLRNGEIEFMYEGCLECGSCRIVCKKGAVQWNYPSGGYGVCFRSC